MTILMNEVRFDAPTAIDGYGPGGFRIGGDWIGGAVFVTASGLASWPVEHAPGAADFEALSGHLDGLDVVLLGLGAQMRHADPALRAAFEERGIGLEPMATPAACRTYNVLLAEGRRVGAALLPVGATS